MSTKNTLLVSVYSDDDQKPRIVADARSASEDGLVRADASAITNANGVLEMPPTIARRFALALLTAVEWDGGERNGR